LKAGPTIKERTVDNTQGPCAHRQNQPDIMESLRQDTSIVSVPFGRNLLRFNGLFLLLVGCAAMVQEALGHFAGAGPLSHLKNSPYTIGGFESHGLAAILGCLLLWKASDLNRRPWHLCALVIHVLLGASNIAFWVSFVVLGLVPVGIATTIAHVAFVALHLVCLLPQRVSKQR
jgi:hypothetical protein